jgi:hypothetical protein
MCFSRNLLYFSFFVILQIKALFSSPSKTLFPCSIFFAMSKCWWPNFLFRCLYKLLVQSHHFGVLNNRVKFYFYFGMLQQFSNLSSIICHRFSTVALKASLFAMCALQFRHEVWIKCNFGMHSKKKDCETKSRNRTDFQQRRQCQVELCTAVAKHTLIGWNLEQIQESPKRAPSAWRDGVNESMRGMKIITTCTFLWGCKNPLSSHTPLLYLRNHYYFA